MKYWNSQKKKIKGGSSYRYVLVVRVFLVGQYGRRGEGLGQDGVDIDLCDVFDLYLTPWFKDFVQVTRDGVVDCLDKL